jgi:thiopurine S-methyltransferase
MNPDYWLDSWKRDHKPFHQRRINPHLQNHWPRLDPGPGHRVFVPLCGQSLDMLWIRGQERGVLGVELAPEPLEAFFREAGLSPETDRLADFQRWRAPGLELLQGDFFSLQPGHLADCQAWYDRAALPALPGEMREQYAAHATSLVKPGCRLLLIAPEYDPAEMDGPPFPVGEPEIQRLFAKDWWVECTVDEETPVADRFAQRGLRTLRERVYLMIRR